MSKKKYIKRRKYTKKCKNNNETSLASHNNNNMQSIELRSQKIQKKSIIVHLPINLTHTYQYKKPSIINDTDHSQNSEKIYINQFNDILPMTKKIDNNDKNISPVSFNLHESNSAVTSSFTPLLQNNASNNETFINNNLFISDQQLYEKTIVELLSSKHYYNDKKSFIEHADDDEKITETIDSLDQPFCSSNNTFSNILHCWHCHDKIIAKPVPLPVKIIQEKIFVKGYFCSFNCALTYNLNSNERETIIQERESLIRLMYKICCQKQLLKLSEASLKSLTYAPNKETLKIFGGTLSYEEFHQIHQKKIKVIYEPLIPLVCFLEENTPIFDDA